MWPFRRKASAEPGAQTLEAAVRAAIIDGGSPFGASASETQAMRIAAVSRCVNIISGAIARLPLHLVTVDTQAETRRLEDDPLTRMLRFPHPEISGFDLRRLATAQVLLHGNSFLRVVRSRGRPIALLPLPASTVVEQNPRTKKLVYRVEGEGQAALNMNSREVVHLRSVSFDGIRGVSLLSQMRMAMETSLNAEVMGASLYQNGMYPGGMFKLPEGKSLNAPAKALLEKSIAEKTGPSAANHTLVLEDGLEWVRTTVTPEDAQFLESRKFSVTDIARFFGVPPHLVGDVEKSTSWGTGIEQQGIAFLNYTLGDWLSVWESSLGSALLRDRPDVMFEHDTQNLVRGDLKARWEAYRIAIETGVLSANEVRTREGQPPREGGDEYITAPPGSPAPDAAEEEADGES